MQTMPHCVLYIFLSKSFYSIPENAKLYIFQNIPYASTEFTDVPPLRVRRHHDSKKTPDSNYPQNQAVIKGSGISLGVLHNLRLL